MKKIAFYCLLCALFSFSSCDLFKIDNYEAPGETLQGEIVDVVTGNPVLTDQGSEGIRIRLTELSWGPNATHNPDFWCKPDGTFQNTKLFKGTYNVRVDGPFIPLYRADSDGNVIADDTKQMEISGVSKVTFEVQPFLNVEWASDPIVSDGQISVDVTVSRGVSVDDFKEKIEPMGGYQAGFTNVTDVRLFVSFSSSVGYRSRDDRYSNVIEYTGSSFNSLLDQSITINSKGAIPSGRTVFIRAAARINYTTEGQRRWNYSEAVQVDIP